MNNAQKEQLELIKDKYNMDEYTVEDNGMVIMENDEYVIYGKFIGDMYSHKVQSK